MSIPLCAPWSTPPPCPSPTSRGGGNAAERKVLSSFARLSSTSGHRAAQAPASHAATRSPSASRTPGPKDLSSSSRSPGPRRPTPPACRRPIVARSSLQPGRIHGKKRRRTPQPRVHECGVCFVIHGIVARGGGPPASVHRLHGQIVVQTVKNFGGQRLQRSWARRRTCCRTSPWRDWRSSASRW